MPERTSLKAVAASVPSLLPQGPQAGKPAMALGRPFTLIGSRNRAHLHLLSSKISRNHSCVIATDNGLYLRDLASRTGVMVNGRRVKEVDLRDGDSLEVGAFQFQFKDPVGPERFPLTPKAAAAVLEIDGATQTPLDTRTLLIGRRPTCDVALTEPAASNTHALIFEVNGERFIRDLGSRTGTLVNGKPVHHQLLSFGDSIRIGHTQFRYVSADGFAQEQEPVARAAGALETIETAEPVAAPPEDEIPLADADELPAAEETPLDEVRIPVEPEIPAQQETWSGEPDTSRVEPETWIGEPENRVGEGEPQADEPQVLAEEPQVAASEPIDETRIPDEPEIPAEPETLDAEPGVSLHEEAWAGEPGPPAVEPQVLAEEPQVAASEAVDEVAVPAPELSRHEGAEHIIEPPEEIPAEPEQRVEEIAPSPLPIAEEEVAVESPPPDSPQIAAPVEDASPPLEVAPAPEQPSIESVDLSAVDFDAKAAAPDEVAASEPTETPAEPTPLIDVPIEPATVLPVAEVLAPAPTTGKGRRRKDGKSRAPKTKSPGRRSKKAQASEMPPPAGLESSTIEQSQPEPPLAVEAAPPVQEAVVPVDVEVIERTEPSPESALDAGPAVQPADSAPAAAEPEAPPASDDTLTDTAFGRAVEDFSGSELGELVEQPLPRPMADEEEVSAELPAPSQQIAAPVDDASAPEPPQPFAPPLDVTTATERPEPIEAHAPPPPEEPMAIASPDTTVSTETPAPPPIDPFFGMERDMGSFIGGMPLSLASGSSDDRPESHPVVASPAPEPVTAEPATAKLAEPTNTDSESPLRFTSEPDPIPALDANLLAAPEPLELFDETAEKLDALPAAVDPIRDVRDVLAPPKAKAPSTPPPAAPKSPPGQPVPGKVKAIVPPVRLRNAPQAKATGNPQGLTSIGAAAAGGTIPFAGAAPVAGRRPASPEAPPAQAPPRRSDVFSNTTLSGHEDAIFGPLPGSVPQIPPATQNAADPFWPLPATDDAAASGQAAAPPSGQNGRRGAGGSNRQIAVRRPAMPAPIPPVNRAAPAQPAPAAPARRPWWRRLGVLLCLMVLAVGVLIAIVLLSQPRHLVHGSLQIKGYDRLDEFARREEVRTLRNELGLADVRRVALGNLQQRNISPGFINDAIAVDAISKPENSAFDDARSALVLTHPSTDIDGDRTRMQALLLALYAQSQPTNQAAESARQQHLAAQQELDRLEQQYAAGQGQISRISGEIRVSGGALSTALLQNPKVALVQLAQQDLQLRDSLDQASALVERNRSELREAQAAAAARADPNAAAQLAQIQQSLTELNAQLETARLARDGRTDQAAKDFAAALDRLQHQLDHASSNDLTQAEQLSRLRDGVDDIRRFNAQLATQRLEDGATVAQLRRQLADRREAHLRQVWTSDETLKNLQEEHDAQSRRFHAALDGGFPAEADKIRGVLDDLEQKMDARRKALDTGPVADDLQQSLHNTIDHLEANRTSGEQEMARRLKQIQSVAAPDAAVPITVSALLTSRQRYAAAVSLSTGDADIQVRKLEGQIAAQQATAETLRQGQGRQAAVDAARAALDASQDAQARAVAAYTANRNLLAQLRELTQVQAQSDELVASLRSARDKVQLQKDQLAKNPVIPSPDATSVTVEYTPDRRLTYMVGALVVLVVVFAVPLWLSMPDSSPSIPMASHVFAEVREVPGHPVGPDIPGLDELDHADPSLTT